VCFKATCLNSALGTSSHLSSSSSFQASREPAAESRSLLISVQTPGNLRETSGKPPGNLLSAPRTALALNCARGDTHAHTAATGRLLELKVRRYFPSVRAIKPERHHRLKTSARQLLRLRSGLELCPREAQGAQRPAHRPGWNEWRATQPIRDGVVNFSS